MENYFSRNLKYLRELKKLSQNKLGELAGVNQTTIARWESEEISPSIDNIFDLSKALNVEIPELVGKDLTLLKIDGIAENNNEKLQEFEGVKICFEDGFDINNASEEDKALLRATIKSIKKNVDNEIDKG